MKMMQRRRPISALELRCTAGCVPERRGSALLIVIGTLALVAVFAAVYVSIGRTDRRAANALRTRIDQRENSIQVAEYLAGVVGDDRLDAYVQYDINGQAFARRELTDAPYTDWSRRSEVDSSDRAYLFTPTGRPYEEGNIVPRSEDFRVANDPWLASTTPTYLGNPGEPDSDVDARPFSSYKSFSRTVPNALNFLDLRDWLQISNFAPDGRPVNLFNLRPNASPVGTSTVAQNVVGGFDAEPGFGSSPRADGRAIRRMSNYLSLLNQESPGDPESFIQAFDPGVDGVWVPGYNVPQNIGINGLDLYNTPAVWTMYQRFMLMPINQPWAMLNRNGQESTWADPDFPLYQYADADGDGFTDSRWFELTAARSAQPSGQSRQDIEQIFVQGDFRYFIAARAVDLSSMVNVNTATDLLTPPTREYPLGLTPADVDLRRLLTLQDVAADFADLNGANEVPLLLAPSFMHRPYANRQRGDALAGSIYPDTSNPSNNFDREVVDYWIYQHDWIGRNVPAGNRDPRQLSSNSPAMLIGRYAYDALRRAINLGGSLSNDYKGYDLQFGGQSAATRTDLVQYQIDPQDTAAVPAPISPEQRYEQYMRVGRVDPLNGAFAFARTTSADPYGSGIFGLDDLAEIMTYHGLNDPDFTSRLERVLDGRYESPNIGGYDDTLQTRRLGPMFSNRSLSLDRFQHGLALVNIDQDPNTPATYDNPGIREVNGRVSFNSMAMMSLTPRKRITPMSGFVSISPNERLDDSSVPAPMSDLAVQPELSTLLSSPTQLFGLYSSALASDLEELNGNWQTDPAMFDEDTFSTLFYGHRGPELAMRIAAHAATNMIDIGDGDSDPTVSTLVLDRQRRNDLTNENNFDDPENDALYQLYPGVADGNLFDLNADNVAPFVLPNGLLSATPSRQIVNVYGIEAMPVITEVSTLYIYHDSIGDDFGGTGDRDYNPNEPRAIGPGISYPTDRVEITIDGTRETDNDDYLGQVLAFQLHNPYGQPISLGGSGLNTNDPLTRQREWDNQDLIDDASNYQFDYYIEFAGRFYKLAQYIEWYPTDENAENYFSIDDPASTLAYGDVPNPVSTIPVNIGGRMEPGTETSASTTPGVYTNEAQYSDFITRNVVLQPGETRVFYVLAEKRFDDSTPLTLDDGQNLDDKWTRLLNLNGDLPNNFTVGGRDDDMDGFPDGAYGDTRGWTGPAEQWIEKQLHVRGQGNRPVMLMEFDPRDGQILNETLASAAVPDPAEPALNPLFPTRNDNLNVRLWKKITTTGEEVDEQDTSNPDVTPSYRNLIQNDLLVDRMALPESLDLDMNEGGDTPVTGTVSYRDDLPEQIAGRPIRNDNTGISVVNWKTVRRVDSETALLEDLPEPGEVAPWLLRSDTNTDLAPLLHDPLNLVISSTLDGAEVVTNDDVREPETPLTTRFETHQTLLGLFNQSATLNGNEIIQTLALAPHYKSDPIGGFPVVSEDDAGNNTIGKFVPMPLSVDGTALEDGKALLYAGDDTGSIGQRPRLADLLLTFGTGASFAPDPTRAVNSPDHVPEEWQTLPEMLAVTLGFDQLPSVAADEARSIWVDAWDATEEEGLLDAGRLALDRFVPFVNNDAPETPMVEFDPGLDVLRGAGVPMALGVFDRARAIERLDRVNDPINASGEQLRKVNLSSATFGTININTAPVEVLRLLPGFAPSRAEYAIDATGAQIEREWWASKYPDTEIPDNIVANTSYDQLRENPDVAAAIVAYRDRINSYPNTAARVEPAGLNVLGRAPLFMSPELGNIDPFFGQNMIGEIPSVMPPFDAGNYTLDRSFFTGIEGLRSTPGFASLGELMAVRVNPDFRTDDLTRWNMLRHMAMDQLGYDERAQGLQEDVDTGENITLLSQVFTDQNGETTGDTVDDYAEKLIMANGVLNMLSVRSDYYAVWFVLQGYREADVANLRPEDPLIPSVHKRYIMVIDRSNVTEPGDQPKIVLLKEVPL